MTDVSVLNMSTIKSDIISTIQTKIGTEFNSWYVGRTSNVRQRLFEELKVNELNGSWMYFELESEAILQEVKQHFAELGVNDVTDADLGKVLFLFKKK